MLRGELTCILGGVDVFSLASLASTVLARDPINFKLRWIIEMKSFNFVFFASGDSEGLSRVLFFFE